MSTNHVGIKQIVLATAISIITIVVILRYTGDVVTWKMISRIDARYLLLALGFHALSWLFWAFRLRFLASLVSHDVSFGLALRATLASGFLAAVTPSSAGGEPLRIKMMADGGMSYGSATAVVLAERLLDGLFFVGALTVFLYLSRFSTGFGLQVGGFFLAVLMIILLFLWEAIKSPQRVELLLEWIRRRFGKGRLVRFLDREVWLFRAAGLQLARESKAQLPVVVAVTALVWLSEFMVPSALLMGLGEPPSFLDSITAQLIMVIISLLPLTPGSSGIAELSMSYLYSAFVPQSALGVLVGLWRGITYFTNLAVGAPLAGASLHGPEKKQ